MMLQNCIPETYLPLFTNVTPINPVKQRTHKMSSGHQPTAHSASPPPGTHPKQTAGQRPPPVHISRSNSFVFKAEALDTTRPKCPVRHLPQTLAGAGHTAAHGSDKSPVTGGGHKTLRCERYRRFRTGAGHQLYGQGGGIETCETFPASLPLLRSGLKTGVLAGKAFPFPLNGPPRAAGGGSVLQVLTFPGKLQALRLKNRKRLKTRWTDSAPKRKGFYFPAQRSARPRTAGASTEDVGGEGHPRTPKVQIQLQSLPGRYPTKPAVAGTCTRRMSTITFHFLRFWARKKKSPNALDSWAIAPSGPGAEAAAAPAPGPRPPRGASGPGFETQSPRDRDRRPRPAPPVSAAGLAAGPGAATTRPRRAPSASGAGAPHPPGRARVGPTVGRLLRERKVRQTGRSGA